MKTLPTRRNLAYSGHHPGMMHPLAREGPLATPGSGLHDAGNGIGRIALVVGEAGIGKTALVDDFLPGSPPRSDACGVRATRSRRPARPAPARHGREIRGQEAVAKTRRRPLS